MRQIGSQEKNRAVLLLEWLLPSVAEVAIYTFIALATVVVINTDFVRGFLLIPDNFSLQTALLGWAENLLAGLVGKTMAATLITGLFWGLVGLGVYFLLIAFGNFSSELGNDILITRYMHPKGDDTYSPLKGLIVKIILHIIFAIIFIVYINVFIGKLLPFIASNLDGIPLRWSESSHAYTAGKMILIEILALHVFVVLSRLLVLRKRVFNFGM